MTDFRWVVSLLVFSVASANAADFSQIGPQASAIQIINARESAEQPVLELVYAVSGGEIGPPTSLTIDLASNYTYVRGGQSAKIIDYKLRRSISLNETDHSFDNVSLYAMVDFKMAETFNRRMQRGLLQKGGRFNLLAGNRCLTRCRTATIQKIGSNGPGRLCAVRSKASASTDAERSGGSCWRWPQNGSPV